VAASHRAKIPVTDASAAPIHPIDSDLGMWSPAVVTRAAY